MDARLLVSVVDDDESVRESLPDLLRELGYEAAVFSSCDDFLQAGDISRSACLILDINMPGMSGIDLERHLRRSGREIPIIFITGHRDEAKRLDLMQRGAVECLFKPFSDTDLLNAIVVAVERGRR